MIFCAVISVAGAVVTQTCIVPKGPGGGGSSKKPRAFDLEGVAGDDNDDNDSIVQ